MKKNIVRSFVCFLFAIIMITECNWGAFLSMLILTVDSSCSYTVILIYVPAKNLFQYPL